MADRKIAVSCGKNSMVGSVLGSKVVKELDAHGLDGVCLEARLRQAPCPTRLSSAVR